MKVRFLKKHLKWKEGDIANVDNTQANYWARCNVTEYVDHNPKEKEEVLLKHLEETKDAEAESADTPRHAPASEENKPKPKRGRKPKK